MYTVIIGSVIERSYDEGASCFVLCGMNAEVFLICLDLQWNEGQV